jgi:hypothetical protein
LKLRFRSEEVNYRIDIEAAGTQRKEGMMSAGDFRQFTIDLVGILKRVYGPEPARRVLTEQLLPVFDEGEIIFPELPEDEQTEPSGGST